MSDFNLKGFNSIKADKGLIDRTIYHVAHPKQKNDQRYMKRIVVSAVSLLILFTGYYLYHNNGQNDASPNSNEIIVTDDGGLQIPTIELPENAENADMMGVIVYNGNIYMQTTTAFDVENAKALLGEKLGTTKGNLDEWSKQDEFSVEFASTGITDVYTVKGYDPDFRIMSYAKIDGEVQAEFYEHLNGITIYDGKDIFGQLKMIGHTESAKYQLFSDWDNSNDNYEPVDITVLNSFVSTLNDTVPYSLTTIEDELGDFRNDEQYRELVVNLSDGTTVSLAVVKGGYIRYGYTDVYFKMDDEVFEEIWAEMN